MTAIDPIVRGIAASAVGTLAMDVSVCGRYRHDGGTASFPAWEPSEGLTTWENATAPARVAKGSSNASSGVTFPAGTPGSSTNATHRGFGLATGAAYGLLVHRRQSKVWYRVPFGAAVWAGGYVVPSQLGAYEQIWKYDLETLGKDLSAHLVFGIATAAAFTLLTNRDGRHDDRR